MFRIFSTRCASVCLCVVAILASRAVADEPRPDSVPAPDSGLSPAEIAGLIEQLDAPEFEVRERATKKLAAVGQPVIEPVVKATEAGSLEVGARCLSVLKDLYHSSDGPTKSAAQAALRQLAASTNRSIARRAGEVLNPPASTRSNRATAALPAAQATSISSRTMNGRTEITVRTGTTTISIAHESGKDITVKVQEPAPAAGKDPVVKEYKAKDIEELKSKHPEAHAHYEKYANRARTINLANIAGAVRPALPAVPAPELPPETRQALLDLQRTRTELYQVYSRLGTLTRRNDVKQEELKQITDELKALTDRIAELQKKLPK